MYYVSDGLYCLSNQVIWQDSPFVSQTRAPALDSDDFVALSTCTLSVVFVWGGRHGKPATEFHYFYGALQCGREGSVRLLCSAALIGSRNRVLFRNG